MKIKDTSKVVEKIIKDTSKVAKKIDPEEIARRLGAEIIGKVDSKSGFWGALLTYLRLKGKKNDFKI